MTISSSSLTSLDSSTSTDSSTSGSASLQKQLATLEKQLSTEMASKDDAKTKLTKTSELNAEISSIEDEIGASEKNSTGFSTTA